jgi:hypothetical protein
MQYNGISRITYRSHLDISTIVPDEKNKKRLKFPPESADIFIEKDSFKREVSRMTISAYQVDNVIKAYSKQYKERVRFDFPQAVAQDRYKDVVMLSNSEDMKADAYRKISYSLLDVLLKDNK